MESVLTKTQETTTTSGSDSWRAQFGRVAQQMREEARSAGIEDMSMEEIDAIIAECRREMRQEQK